jgi:hypothetical protein
MAVIRGSKRSRLGDSSPYLVQAVVADRDRRHCLAKRLAEQLTELARGSRHFSTSPDACSLNSAQPRSG